MKRMQMFHGWIIMEPQIPVNDFHFWFNYLFKLLSMSRMQLTK